ncbi:tape measure protein [Corynebacterium sp. Q4381]|uniref:tape measure protein n=1 Tax=Corynebacterium sp. Marseille-Q4381 TaxID=3121597 RepID=UPI002FE65695
MSNAVWVPVNAEMKGFIGTLVKEASGAARQAGQKVTDEMGKAGKNAGEALAGGLASQAAKVEQITAKVANARKVEARAAADVISAEQELQTLRGQADASASQIAAAEEKLATAKNRHQDATVTLSRTEQDLESVRAGGEATSTALARAEDNLARAKTQAQTAADKLHTAELKLGEAKERQAARAQAVRDAEMNLINVRDRYGANTRETERAERQLQTAKDQAAASDRRVATETGNVTKKRAELASATENVAAKTRTHKATQQDVAAAERNAGNEAESAGRKIRGLGEDMDGASRSGGGFMSSLGGFAKKAALAGGAFLGVASASQALGGGFERLNNLQRADIMFRNIGLSADQTATTMDDLNDLVTGTNVSLADAAGTASMLMQAGVEAGKPLNDSIKALTNISAIAGGSADDVGMVLMQIKAAGRLMGGDAMQLQQRGVNIYGYLADSLGMSFEEVKKLGEEGKITYEQVIDAINAKTGDLAKEMGDTLPAKMGNFKTAVSSAAAELIKPFMEPMTRGVETLTQKIKDAKPAITEFAEGVKNVFTWLGDHPAVIAGIASGLASLAAGAAAVKAVGIAKEAVAAARGIKTFADMMKILNLSFLASPVGLVVTGIAALTAGLTYFFTKTETGQELWSTFMDGLRSAGEWLKGTFAPIFEYIGDAVSSAFSVVAEKVDAVVDTVKGVFEVLFNGTVPDSGLFGIRDESSALFGTLITVRNTIITLKDAAVAAFDWMGAKWQEFTIGFGQFYNTWVSPVVTFFTEAFNVIKEVVGSTVSVISENARIFGDMLGLVFSGVRDAFSVVGSVITSVATAVIQPAWTLIQMGAQIMWTVLQGVFQMIQTGFEFVGTMIQSVWTNIIAPTWGFLKEAAGLLADVLTGNFENIGNRFSSMGDFISQIVQGPINVAMDLFRGLVGLVGDAWRTFQSTVSDVVDVVKTKITEMVNNVQEIPGKIKSIFADAGQWLLSAGRDIISGLWTGMQQMWDNMTGWLTSLPGRIRNAVGSVSFGFGGGSSNANGSFAQYVTGGIAAAEVYANGGGNLPTQAVIERPHGKRGLVQWAEAETGGEAFIPLAPSKRERSEAILERVADNFGYALVDSKTGVPYQSNYRGYLGPQVVGSFADGGITGDDLMKFLQGGSVNGYQAAYPLEGAKYLWAGQHPYWGDCSGTVSSVTSLAIGENPAPRRYATGSQGSWLSSHGFLRGRGGEGDLRIGFRNGGPAGGHTSGTLPNGVNFEMGGARGNGQLGGRAAGAWDSYYNEFFYLPMQEQKWLDPEVTGLKDLSADERQVVVAAVDTAELSTSTPVQQGPQTPYEAFATTFAAEMGNRTVGQIGFDAVADFFGVDPKATRKVLFTPMDELLGVADVNQTAAVGNPSTNVAGAHAAQLHDEALTSMTPAELARDPQLSQVKDADVVKQPDVPEWGPQFFAHEIASQAKSMGLDKLAAQIGIATALVESGNPMKMYANRAVPESLSFRHDALGSDHDSVGLFQQRNNGAWGSVKDRMTPAESAGMFLRKLSSFDYRAMAPGDAAQRVQVSAFPDRYGQQMAEAAELLSNTGVFDRGGLARGLGFLRKATIEPEEVLSPAMTPLFRRFIGFLPGMMETIDTARAELRIAAAGGDAGYGALAELFGAQVGYQLADSAFWAGGLVEELQEAFAGGDFGYGSAAHIFGEEAGRALVDEASWLGTAVEELTAAARGEDFGLAATARYLGDERLAAAALDGVGAAGTGFDNAFQALSGVRQVAQRAGSTVVINIDGQEVMRRRLEDVEEQLDLNTEDIIGLKTPRRPTPMMTTRGGAM